MYTVKRAPKIRETLRLEDGEKVLEVKVSLDVSEAVDRYWKYYENFCIAKDAIRKAPSEVSQEQFGNAVLALFGFVFGGDQTRDILSFYDGNYAEMLTDIAPFVLDVVYPKLREASKTHIKKVRGMRR